MSTPISLGIYVLDGGTWRTPTPYEVNDLVKESHPPSISYDPAESGEFFVSEEFDEEAEEAYWVVMCVSEADPVSDRIDDDEEAHELCETMNMENDSQRKDWEQDDFIQNGFTWYSIEEDLAAWSKRIHFDVTADVMYDDDGSRQRIYIRGDEITSTAPELRWPEVPGFPAFESEE